MSKKRRSKYRKSGELPSLSGNSIPSNILFFDTETWVFTINRMVNFDFRLGVAIHVNLSTDGNEVRRRVYKYNTKQGFIDILDKLTYAKKVLYVFAHNTGFDLRVLELHTLLNLNGWTTEPPIINNRVFIWKATKDKKKIEFLDTANLGVHSVAQLGKDLGYDKSSVDFNDVSDNELYDYCERDVEIIEKFVVSYVKYTVDNNLGSFKPTLASQAFTAFRTSFMSTAPNIHNIERIIELERKGYCGGRVECFYLGKKTDNNFYYVDVNSMYPYCMRDFKLPYRYYRSFLNVPPNKLLEFSREYYMIADVTLKTELPAYPLRTKHKLIFPIGRFRTVLHHWELEFAIGNNSIEKVHEISLYEHEYIFSDYVNFFYSEKVKHTETGNKTQRYISKLFLNTLYGKFGQLNVDRELVSEDSENTVYRLPVYNDVTDTNFVELNWYGKLYHEFRQGEATYSIPYLSGSITALARMVLFSYMLKAGLENVYYCDTDSMILNQDGYDNIQSLLSDTELGKLGLEQEATTIVINGNKDYVFGDTVKRKGIPTTSIEIDVDMFEYLQFEGMTTWLNRGADVDMIATKRIKRRLRHYDKGVVNPDTGYVMPFVLNQQ